MAGRDPPGGLYRDVYRGEAQARIALLLDVAQMPTALHAFHLRREVLSFFAREARYDAGPLGGGAHWPVPRTVDDLQPVPGLAVAAGAWSEMILEHSACLGRYNPEGPDLARPEPRDRAQAVVAELAVLEAVFQDERVQQLPAELLRTVQDVAVQFVMVEAVVTQLVGIDRAADLIVRWTQGLAADQIRALWLAARDQHHLHFSGYRHSATGHRTELEAACTRRRPEFRDTSVWPNERAGRLDPWSQWARL